MAYNLSEKAIGEKYEDLLFTKVMALYAEEESAKILEAAEAEASSDPKNVEKIYSKIRRKENLAALWKYSRKLVTFAAMVVFVAVISLSSVVVASAEAREAVAEAIYHLVLRKTDRYTEVSIGNSTGFIDPEIYDWEGAYAPTYMPKEYILKEKSEMPNRKSVTYINGEKYVAISQSVDGVFQIDTEDADIYKKISINESDAVYVENKGFVFIVWSIGEKTFSVRGTINPEEALKIAESLKPIEKYEAPAEEEYTFVDPEIYTWDDAYGMTYVPDGFNLSGVYKHPGQSIIDYSKENEYFSFLQAQEASADVDTENAQIVERIIINNSEGLLVVKNGLTQVVWSEKNIYMTIIGTAPTEEIIKVAEGIKPLGKTATEEYEFVDPEIYTWDNAYGMTYISENYCMQDCIKMDTEKIIIYSDGENEIIFSQACETTVEKIDTENADTVETITIGKSKALLVVKKDVTTIAWQENNVFMSIVGTAPTEEIIKIAEGIKPIN